MELSTCRIIALVAIATSLSVGQAAQADLYWDIDGAAAGAGGATPAGTWDAATSNWSTSANGDVAATTWVSDDIAHFSAGSIATGAFSVTLDGTQSASEILFEEGTTTVTGGTKLTLNGVARVDVASGAAGTINSAIGGTSGLTKTGTGTLTLGGANTYSGGTNIAGGKLRLFPGPGTSNPLPDKTDVTIASPGLLDLANFSEAIGSVAGTGNLVADSTAGTLTVGGLGSPGFNNNNSTTFSGNITNTNGGVTSLGIIKHGTGTWTLSGNNQFSGMTTISQGAIAVRSNTALGTTAGVTRVSSELQIDGSGLVIDEPLTVSGSSISDCLTSEFSCGTVRNLANDNTLNGAISLLPFGRISSDSGTLFVTGTVQSSSPTTGALIVSGNGNVTISGVISNGTNPLGTGSPLIKSANGAGTLTLTAANTYTGTTTVSGGKLLVNNTSGSGTGSGAVNVNSAGIVGGTGSIAGLITVNSVSGIAPGASIGTLTAAGGLTLEAASFLNFELGAPGFGDQINVTPTNGLTLNGGYLNLSDAGGLAAGTYLLIDYAGAIMGGGFASLDNPIGPAEFSYALVNNSANTSIDLLVSTSPGGVPGDYNNNGVVDAADYVLWRKGVQPLQNEVAAPIGTTDEADYASWRARFHNTAGSASGALAGGGAIPEPTTAALLFAGLMALKMRIRQRSDKFNSRRI